MTAVYPRRALDPRGMVLLEVIVAMTILSIGALSLVVLASESTRALARAESRDADVQRASAFLNQVALWPRADLDRHLGDRSEGPWRLRIDRALPTVYAIALRDSTNNTPLLSTALYRADDGHVAP